MSSSEAKFATGQRVILRTTRHVTSSAAPRRGATVLMLERTIEAVRYSDEIGGWIYRFAPKGQWYSENSVATTAPQAGAR